MGWSEPLDNGNHRACWRDELGRRRSRSGFRRRAEATRYANEQEGKSRRGEPTADGRAPTWGDWCPIWQAGRLVEPSTMEIDLLRIERYLRPRWGTRRLNRITRAEVQDWANELSRTLAPGSVEKVVRLFSASMTVAVRDERIPLAVNPCAGVTLPTVAPGHERFLTHDEIDSIVYYLTGPYRLAALVAVGTGMRWGELAGLHWQRVDLDTALIDIVETWDSTADRIKTYPKGKKRRAVPIPTWLQVPLKDAREEVAAKSCGQQHAAGGAKCRSGLVVTGPHGGPLNGRNFGRRQWADACLLAKIDPPRLHDLRHTYASWLVQAGVDLAEVQRLLGHATLTTAQRYAHLGTSQNDKVRAALG